MLVTRAIKFAYSNARTKAMKTLLLPRPTIEQMANSSRIAEIIGILERTDYKQDMTDASLRYAGADMVEYALGKNLVRSARRIMAIAPGDAIGAILSILEKFDLYNLKTILLGRHLGHSNEEILPLLVPAGSLTQDELKRLLDQSNVESLVRFLGPSPYGQALLPLLDEYKKSGDLQPMLNSLDKYIYSRLPKLITVHYPDELFIKKLVKTEIDVKNLMNLLRSKRENIEEAKFFSFLIPGGSIPSSEWKRIASLKTIEDIIAAVRERYPLDAALERYRIDHSLVHFEIDLERRILERGLRALRAAVLSTGSLVDFLYLKEAEIGNIRKIIRAKEFNLPAEKLMETLVLVD